MPGPELELLVSCGCPSVIGLGVGAAWIISRAKYRLHEWARNEDRRELEVERRGVVGVPTQRGGREVERVEGVILDNGQILAQLDDKYGSYEIDHGLISESRPTREQLEGVAERLRRETLASDEEIGSFLAGKFRRNRL